MTVLQKFLANLPRTEAKLKKHRIVIVSGGFSEEREASLETGEEVQKQLANNGFSTHLIDPVSKDISQEFIPGDIVFNCLHGSFGESGHLPAILDYLKVPYTFSGIYASAVTMDKLYFKACVQKLGFEVPKDEIDPGFIKVSGPFIHKKTRGGGSIGMLINNNRKSSDGSYTEQFSDGRILTLGVLEKKGEYIPMGVVEIKLKGGKFYDKEAKYETGHVSYAPYSGRYESMIVKKSLDIFRFLGIKGCARVDLIEHGSHHYFLEINTVPGLYPTSNLAFSAKLKGLGFYELLIWLLAEASYEEL